MNCKLYWLPKSHRQVPTFVRLKRWVLLINLHWMVKTSSVLIFPQIILIQRKGSNLYHNLGYMYINYLLFF